MRQMKLNIIILTSVLLLAGCAEYQYVKQAVATTAQQAADAALEATLWQLCKVSSYGSIKRWVKNDQKLADSLQTVCNSVPDANVIVEDEE